MDEVQQEAVKLSRSIRAVLALGILVGILSIPFWVPSTVWHRIANFGQAKCNYCNGTGKGSINLPCAKCHGTGRAN